MDWKSVLNKVAPTVVSVLAGPVAGTAVKALGDIIGLEDATTDKIKAVIEGGNLTTEQLAEIKKLELFYKNEEDERGFKFADLVISDIKDARAREIATKDYTNRILAYTIVGGFLAMAICVLGGWARAESVLAGTIIGYVSAKCEQVLSYYFGSTSTSARKTELLAESSKAKEK